MNIEASRGTFFTVPVEVIDERRSFGRLDVLVRPKWGTGEAWVNSDRVEVTDEDVA
jgi:hypothetical protein